MLQRVEVKGDKQFLYHWLEPKEKPWLNLGCGYKHIRGALNTDINPVCEPDLCFDLNDNQRSWPVPENEFGYVSAVALLEHIPNVLHVIGQIWRCLRGGGRADIIVPYWLHAAAIEDPTHIRAFGRHSAGYYEASLYSKNTSWYTEDRFNFHVVETRLVSDQNMTDEEQDLLNEVRHDPSAAARWLVHLTETGNMPGFWRYIVYRLDKIPLPPDEPPVIKEIVLGGPRT